MKTYRNVTIYDKNKNGMYTAHTNTRAVQADTLHGIKKMIDEYQEPVLTIQTQFPIAVYIYEVDDETIFASVGSAYTYRNDCIENIKPRQYKLYYNAKRDSYFFRCNNRRFFLDEALRTSI